MSDNKGQLRSRAPPPTTYSGWITKQIGVRNHNWRYKWNN
jgi:hypothetical protein